jgi:hypothetical protein
MTATELSQVLGPIWDEINRGVAAQERVAAALERIAAGVEWIVSSRPSDEDEDDMGCPHPLEKRLALGTVGQGWQCACGYRELALKVD